MSPADIDGHNRPGREVYVITVNGFAVQVDAGPLPEPRLLAIHVDEIIIASSELEGLLQPTTGNPLVVLCRADVEGPSILAQVLAQPAPVASHFGPSRAGAVKRSRLHRGAD